MHVILLSAFSLLRLVLLWWFCQIFDWIFSEFLILSEQRSGLGVQKGGGGWCVKKSRWIEEGRLIMDFEYLNSKNLRNRAEIRGKMRWKVIVLVFWKWEISHRSTLLPSYWKLWTFPLEPFTYDVHQKIKFLLLSQNCHRY